MTLLHYSLHLLGASSPPHTATYCVADRAGFLSVAKARVHHRIYSSPQPRTLRLKRSYYFTFLSRWDYRHVPRCQANFKNCVEQGSPYVAQAGREHLDSRDSPPSASKNTGITGTDPIYGEPLMVQERGVITARAKPLTSSEVVLRPGQRISLESGETGPLAEESEGQQHDGHDKPGKDQSFACGCDIESSNYRTSSISIIARHIQDFPVLPSLEYSSRIIYHCNLRQLGEKLSYKALKYIIESDRTNGKSQEHIDERNGTLDQLDLSDT
ncbi:hypothetical protein AAY473_040127 [Plecturocebus cupreus]